ncbi:MAG: 1-acyl-sn-glycerol-3-phosphate acyltransferase [Planctomycetia bacterium]|nr:1-acyl-sn-glycerol-3-phosphate acyltransferase [Planctomycetia bacterium]
MLSETATTVLAGGLIAALAAALVAGIVARYWNAHYTLAQFPWFYPFNLVMARVLWRAKVTGRLKIPADQGAVIVCNHVGPIDPSFIALATDRIVHWMVAKEYCDHPAMSWFFRTMQAIPVNRRGVDTAATKLAIRYAGGGGLVGLFPEGRINDTGRLLLPGRPGAALIALRARVPVVPCYLTGAPNDGTSYGAFFMSARAHLRIGEPIDISEFYGRDTDKEVLEELTRRFLIEMARLAGVENYQPELAGRRWRTAAELEPA